MKRVFILAHAQARRLAAQHCMEAPDGHVVTFSPPKKSREQEEKYHAMIGDIARQYSHAGRKWDEEDMKRLLVDSFRRDTKDDEDLRECWKSMGDMRLVPAIGADGFVALGYPTKKFPKKLASAFIEWLYAFGAEAEIAWSGEAVPA
jgi:hypothetical protein